MSAIRKLACEAADNGLLAPELAAGISRVKSAKTQGIRTGNWLSQRQAQALLSAPDITTLRGLRDRAILAVLLGCGLRRSEVAAFTFTHLQQRDGRWCIVDLIGKHGRVRTAPMPTWVKVAIDAWTLPAGVADGHVFRPVNRADRITGEGLGEKVVWQLIKPYAEAAGRPCLQVAEGISKESTKSHRTWKPRDQATSLNRKSCSTDALSGADKAGHELQTRGALPVVSFRGAPRQQVRS
jgi:integrase